MISIIQNYTIGLFPIFQNRKLMPKFVVKEMEATYIDELTQAINTLKSNLESLPVQQGKTQKAPKLPKIKGIGNKK